MSNTNNQQLTDYIRIAEAIRFVSNNVHQQPTLDEVADHIHLSPFHFQRLFSRWAGITPKQFLQTLTLKRAKELLEEPISVLETSNSLGLSSSSRLHDHFVTLEAVTPGEYKSGGAGLKIEYGVAQTPFGEAFIAFTPRGITRFAFTDTESIETLLSKLAKDWPLANIEGNAARALEIVDSIFDNPKENTPPFSLHISGTNFQVNVWKSLLQIPEGKLTSYSNIASAIGKPKAVRAVGTAIGSNPVGLLIPCHRVIRQSGGLGGYRWGLTRKQALLAWESSRHIPITNG